VISAAERKFADADGRWSRRFAEIPGGLSCGSRPARAAEERRCMTDRRLSMT
jgi:hypothetical protein